MKLTYLAWVAVAAMLVAAPMALAKEKGGEKAKGAGVFGELTKIINDKDAKSIEIAVKSKDKAAAPETKTIAFDADTKVLIGKAAEAGATEKPKPEDGKIDDLKVGQKVAVKLSDDGKKALEILVLPAHNKK